MPIECVYDDLLSHSDTICEFVSENCIYSYINFYSIHYCYLNAHLWLTIPITSVILLFCFYLLSDTSNKYLSPSLTIHFFSPYNRK